MLNVCDASVILISGVELPVPSIVKSKLASSESLFAIVMVALRSPVADGSKVTSNVVDPPGETGEAQPAPIVKSAAFAPEARMEEIVRSPLPVFSIVNVRTIEPAATSAAPKNVLSPGIGDVSPSPISKPLPDTAISGAGVSAVTVKVVATTFPFAPPSTATSAAISMSTLPAATGVIVTE